MTTPPLLSVSGLTVDLATRGGTVRAVDGVSFDIPAGRTLALVGESGSGKSMTATSLLGLTPAGTIATTGGTAIFQGRNLLGLDEPALRAIRGKAMAVVFQDPAAALDPLMTVAAQIREALPKGADASARVAALLHEVGLARLPHIERRYPHELSGGQQQRVAIAMALAGDPALLIADEPTTALDMSVQAQILHLLTALRQARGMAMLLITHDLGVVSRHADMVVVLRRGKMIESGPTARVLERPESDYTRMLIDSRPRLDGRLAGVAAGDPILEVENLSVTYPGPNVLSPRIVAVDGVSLSVPVGGALGIVGESGSGKSTLAKAIVGLVAGNAGAIRFEGRRIPHPARMEPAMRARLQYIFQDSYGALNPRLSVEQAVGEPFAITGMPRRQRRDAVVALLEEVGLTPAHLARFPHEMSGGQRQRVNIARALDLSPRVLICDEIVSALDVSIQAQVLRLLRTLQQSRQLTLVFISHDLAVVAGLCDRVMVMRSGRVVETGTVREVFDRPAHDYTRDLLAAAAALHGDAPAGASTDMARLPALSDS